MPVRRCHPMQLDNIMVDQMIFGSFGSRIDPRAAGDMLQLFVGEARSRIGKRAFHGVFAHRFTR